jgi:hypothetical protein
LSLATPWCADLPCRIQNTIDALSQDRSNTSVPSWSLPVSILALGLTPVRRAQMTLIEVPFSEVHAAAKPPYRCLCHDPNKDQPSILGDSFLMGNHLPPQIASRLAPTKRQAGAYKKASSRSLVGLDFPL